MRVLLRGGKRNPLWNGISPLCPLVSRLTNLQSRRPALGVLAVIRAFRKTLIGGSWNHRAKLSILPIPLFILWVALADQIRELVTAHVISEIFTLMNNYLPLIIILRIYFLGLTRVMAQRVTELVIYAGECQNVSLSNCPSKCNRWFFALCSPRRRFEPSYSMQLE